MRPVLVPAIIAAFGESINWWPSRMPERKMQSYEEEYRHLLTGEDEPPPVPEAASSEGGSLREAAEAEAAAEPAQAGARA